jgi:hypothetical protein
MRTSFGIVKQALAVLAIGAASTVAFAQPQSPASRAAAVAAAALGRGDLETAFWRCDHASTIRELPFSMQAACSSATEEFKQHRFGGDGDELIRWWRQHKPAEHLKLRMQQGL